MSDHYITWLRNNELLASSLHCDKCEEACTINKRTGQPNRQSFRCKKNKNCEFSIKKGSFFELTKYSLHDIMIFIRYYIHGMNMLKCCLYSGVTYGPTSVEYCVFIREIFQEYVYRMLQTEKLSGVIEIDESAFGRKIKYSKGKKRNCQVWIFGKYSY